jgi:hypothetical protein
METEEHWIRVGGPIDETRVSLCVYAYDLDSSEVTTLLGLTPSSSHKRGDRISPRHETTYKEGAWILEYRAAQRHGPEDAIADLIAMLPSDVAFWEDFTKAYRVKLSLSLTLYEWNRGFSLSPAIQKRLVEIGAEIDFEIWYIPPDPSESPI